MSLRTSAALTAAPSSRSYQFFRPGLGRVICVRTVRSGLGVGFQRVGADGRSAALAAIVRPTVRIVGYRPRGRNREAVGGIGFRRGRGRCGRCGRSRPGAFLARGGGDVDRAGSRPALAREADLDADLAQKGRPRRSASQIVLTRASVYKLSSPEQTMPWHCPVFDAGSCQCLQQHPKRDSLGTQGFASTADALRRLCGHAHRQAYITYKIAT